MVTINLYLLLALLQGLLIVTVVLAIWVWRLSRVKRRLRRAETQLEHLQTKPTAQEYLQQEQKSYESVQLEGEDASWRDVRIAYLKFELQNVERSDKSSPADLGNLRKQLAPLLSAEKPPANEEDKAQAEVDEENIDFPEMLQRQQQLLDALKSQVHGVVSDDQDLQSCDEKLDKLDLVGRELESCTRMMEEENNFLRDQVRTLIAMSSPEQLTENPDVPLPDAAEPETSPLEPTEPELTEEVYSPEAESSEPKPAESESAQPEPTEPESSEPEPTEPKPTDSTKSRSMESESTESDSAEPDSTKPDSPTK